MKTWTMPQIDIDAFEANEYCASCTWSGGNLNIQCEFVEDTATDFSPPSHQGQNSPCHDTIQVSASQWSLFRSAGSWYASDGEWYNLTNGNSLTPDDYHGDYAYYVWTKEYPRNSGQYWVIFSIYRWRYGSYRLQDEGHRVRLGASGNPDS